MTRAAGADAVAPPPHADLRCGRCGERIGVYEPLVHVCAKRAQRTSRLAADPAELRTGRCYHADCWQHARP
jgi:hypothetical protein